VEGVRDTGHNGEAGAAVFSQECLTTYENAYGVSRLATLARLGHRTSRSIECSATSGTSGGVPPRRFTMNARAVGRLDLDGVDVDLERGGDMKSTSDYPAFVSALISAFRPEGKLVTSALAQYIVQDAGANAALFTVINSFDFINLMIYSTKMTDYTNEVNWWVDTVGVPKVKLTWGIEFTSQLTVATVQQITMASKAYGGVMVWEYSQPTEPQLWPAVQGAL
jgi:hypothetical protein